MAAPIIVTGQHVIGNNGTGALTLTFASNVTAGNRVIVFQGCTGGGGNTLHPPAMSGEMFVPIVGLSSIGSAGQAQGWMIEKAAGGQKIINLSASTDMMGAAIESSGGPAPVDAAGQSSSATMSVSTSAATKSATDLILAFFFDNVAGPILTAGTGYAQVDFLSEGAGAQCLLVQQKTVAATGTQTATATGNGTDTVNQGILALQPTPAKGHIQLESGTGNVELESGMGDIALEY